MQIFRYLVFALFSAVLASKNSTEVCESPSNSCVTFSVSSGTGCTWMCNYCAGQLGTNNYYFTDSVCTYQEGGCVGNPVAGKSYTCCSV